MLNHKFCVAPMMDWTDRHDRVFLRQFSQHTMLYTEMVTSAALEYGNANYLLKHDPNEHPVALQIGGSNPKELSRGAKLGEQAGLSAKQITLLTNLDSFIVYSIKCTSEFSFTVILFLLFTILFFKFFSKKL